MKITISGISLEINFLLNGDWPLRSIDFHFAIYEEDYTQ